MALTRSGGHCDDGRETLAEVIGTDPESDLAVLHIDLEDLPVIEIADSADVAVGDVALAIGNPFGVGQTVTMGIISANGRNRCGLNAYEDFIQTDAAINPGNSATPHDPDGALVGINTAIFSRSGGSQGIGFAIPANLAHSVLDELVTQGRPGELLQWSKRCKPNSLPRLGYARLRGLLLRV